MPEVSVRLVSSQLELEAVRALCREWLEWHWREYPRDWPVDGNPMAHEKFEAVIRDLEVLHARPKGGIVLASLDDRAAGCVMYSEAKPGLAVFNRMYVSEGGRGHGLGRLMLERMFEQMVADGYEKVFFSSARFLTHARAMYERAGFVDMPHPADFPDAWRDYVYFMQRSLV